jgi:ATP synthase protein I
MPYRLGESAARTIRTIGSLSAVGLMFVLSVVIGAAIGYWLDELFGSSPWFFILFFFLGVAAGMLNVYRTATKLIR